ncbi:Uncharacterized protein HZ326_27107 [Fusarium oxysporum f. sp. albedinis]|nr:Uncharacterized protein HZ326_27107 [Fusarium oxysporum f. sp. albedinis]
MEPTAVPRRSGDVIWGRLFLESRFCAQFPGSNRCPANTPTFEVMCPRKTRFLGIVRVDKANETTCNCRMNR